MFSLNLCSFLALSFSECFHLSLVLVLSFPECFFLTHNFAPSFSGIWFFLHTGAYLEKLGKASTMCQCCSKFCCWLIMHLKCCYKLLATTATLKILVILEMRVQELKADERILEKGTKIEQVEHKIKQSIH